MVTKREVRGNENSCSFINSHHSYAYNMYNKFTACFAGFIIEMKGGYNIEI